MTDPSNYLDAVQARCDAATEGPWEHDGDIPARQWGVVYQRDALVDSIGQSDRPVFTLQLSSIPRASWMADADFIAHARTDVPRLVAAVEAVLGWHYIDSGMDGERICSHDGRNWPCPTIRAMQTALGGTS